MLYHQVYTRQSKTTRDAQLLGREFRMQDQWLAGPPEARTIAGLTRNIRTLWHFKVYPLPAPLPVLRA
jgi:hypothetical protein